MPPGRKGIVKSGNAGNSSKAAAKPAPVQQTDVEKPLFPPGSKYPLSLLHERCQKNGWDKPVVDTRKHGDGWTFVVTLSRFNKKASSTESVRMEPHPPYTRPTSIEAKHWGATYALYRFCNGIQLNRVLPPGPRDYWNELAAEHKVAPDHRQWMYAADPWAARQEVEERQAAAAAQSSSTNTRVERDDSHPLSRLPEVRMAASLREDVETSIKRAISLYELPQSSQGTVLLQEESQQLPLLLGKLGFSHKQARDAIDFLSKPSTLADKLTKALAPIDACVSYLMLHIPECDLPQRFLPTKNSSNPFITSVHSGADDLKKRWVEEKAIKEAGYPDYVVTECTKDFLLACDWDRLLVVLGNKLIGLEPAEPMEKIEPYSIDLEEAEALGAVVEATHIAIPMFSAPINLHIQISEDAAYPRPHYTPMYLTSESVPAYIRLHLLSQLLKAMKEPIQGEEEGFFMAIIRILEAEWAYIEDNGPPQMFQVLHNLLAPKEAKTDQLPLSLPMPTHYQKPNQKIQNLRDDRSDEQVKADFDEIRNKDTFKGMLSKRQKLPATALREQFLHTLGSARAVIVVGETGCGKTTQLPQFILDSLIDSNRGSKASVIVTQPRRISAVSVAARVSAERLDDGSVGYAIRGEARRSKKTKLLFCTTGVLLRRLSLGDTLGDVSHIVVDEVHERSLDGDFLILELKELLDRHPTLKVVLMSATINHEIFVKYFNNAPLLTIPGFTHPVNDFYLEDIVNLISYQPQSKKAGGKRDNDELQELQSDLQSRGLDDATIAAVHAITRNNPIDYQLISALVEHVVSTTTEKGGILIFLSGVQEIRQCIDAIQLLPSAKQMDVFPLHANLTNDEQQQVFARRTKWKVIVATNVAETSITIDDILYVIDSGKVKEIYFDAEIGLTRLSETWVTQAAAKQRRGRAGRTQAGTCYKLYTRKQEEKLQRFPKPEILRLPLDAVFLSVKVARENEDAKMFLGKAIDPPSVAALDDASNTLRELGAITQEGAITPLGRHIAMLPLDLRLAKMLVLGTIFQCLDPVLTIAALLSSKPLFVSPMDKREEAKLARMRFLDSESDILTDVNAYSACIRMRSEGKSTQVIKSFCDKNFISVSTVREITLLRHDLFSSLTDTGLIPLKWTPTAPELNVNSTCTNLIKSVVLGGLWPRVARAHLPDNAIKFDKVQAGTVQRENAAKEFKLYDLKSGRVFLHPASVLFENTNWKSPFLVYFQKNLTTKVFLRDATQVPMYALLLFGGRVSVDHIKGVLKVGSEGASVSLKAWPRIGVLVNQLRDLLDAYLLQCVDGGVSISTQSTNPIIMSMLMLLANDGLSELS